MTATNSRGDRIRLFFALWPAPSVREALAAVARQAQSECGGRAIAPDNIHLTLFFVGSTERARVPALERAAAAARSSAFSLVLDRVGYWRHNRIVWAGATRCPAELAALAESLRIALAREGVHGEERPYVPHATLLREADRKPAELRMQPCPWAVHEFVLLESRPVRGGVCYEPVAHWPLC